MANYTESIKTGGGTIGQVCALTQIFAYISPNFVFPEIIKEILKYQSFEDKDIVERNEQKINAIILLNNEQYRIYKYEKIQKKIITNLLCKTIGMCEVSLVDKIFRQSRNTLNKTLGECICNAGQKMRIRIQKEYDHWVWVNKQNEELRVNAFLRAYPNLNIDNYQGNVPAPLMRQLANVKWTYEHLP